MRAAHRVLIRALVLVSAQVVLADEVVYESKWENAGDQIGAEWSTNGQVEISPNGKRVYLGGLAERGALLTLQMLPPHELIRIECDLIVRGSWDGGRSGNGGDRVQMWLGDGRDLLDATFANREAKLAGQLSQSYPLGWEYGREFKEKHGAVEIASLGYAERESDGIALTPNDAVYRLDFYVPHAADALRWRIRCRNYYDKYQDQYAGLDNVRLTAMSKAVGYNDQEWKELVKKVEGDDVMAADKASWEMLAAPSRAREYVQPVVVAVDDKRFENLLTELASPEEEVHGGAARKIEALGRPALRRIQATIIALEDLVVRARLENVVDEIKATEIEEDGYVGHFKKRMRGILELPRK